MARRRITAASRVRFTRAVRQPRTERRLAAANLLQEIRDPQRCRKRQRDDNRARNARILPGQNQLDSEHVLTSTLCLATRVPDRASTVSDDDPSRPNVVLWQRN